MKVTTYAAPFRPPFFRSLENLYSFDPYILAKMRQMSYFDPYFSSKLGKMYSFDPPFFYPCSVSSRQAVLSIPIQNLPMDFFSDSGHTRPVLHAGIANLRWRWKRSQHSRHMRNPQFYVSSKRSILGGPLPTYDIRSRRDLFRPSYSCFILYVLTVTTDLMLSDCFMPLC